MNEITVKAPSDFDCGSMKEWPAEYTVYPTEGRDTLYIAIEARSSIEVVVAKVGMPYHVVDTYYFISVPNFGVGIPGIDTLQMTYWITEKLMNAGMPAPDAVTVAQVLRRLEDF